MTKKYLLKEGSGIVYHYTSLDTFLKILDGVDNGNFIFHATDIFSMNDPTEFIHGFRQLWSILPKIENDLYRIIRNTPRTNIINEVFLENKFRLSNMWSRMNGSNKSWLKAYVNAMHQSYASPFVVSFSCHNDNLPMWSTYGDNGRGVAIGIDIQSFFTKMTIDDGTVLLDFTRYNENELHSILVEYDKITINHPLALYAKIYIKNYLENINDPLIDDGKLIMLQKMALDNITKLASAMIKSDVYKYEEESRLISFRQDIKEVKLKVSSRKRMIPYIEVGIPTLKLKKLVIGPCCDFINVKKALRTRIEQLGVPMKDGDFVKSKVPFRLI